MPQNAHEDFTFPLSLKYTAFKQIIWDIQLSQYGPRMITIMESGIVEHLIIEDILSPKKVQLLREC